MTVLKVSIDGTDQETDFDPCPFCGSNELGKTDWWDDDGEYDAICCRQCKAEAPAKVWQWRVREGY